MLSWQRGARCSVRARRGNIRLGRDRCHRGGQRCLCRVGQVWRWLAQKSQWRRTSSDRRTAQPPDSKGLVQGRAPFSCTGAAVWLRQNPVSRSVEKPDAIVLPVRGRQSVARVVGQTRPDISWAWAAWWSQVPVPYPYSKSDFITAWHRAVPLLTHRRGGIISHASEQVFF